MMTIEQTKVDYKTDLIEKLIILLNIHNGNNVELFTASVLNSLGFKTQKDKTWDKGSVATQKKASFTVDKTDKKEICIGLHLNKLYSINFVGGFDCVVIDEKNYTDVLSYYEEFHNYLEELTKRIDSTLEKGIDYDWIISEYNSKNARSSKPETRERIKDKSYFEENNFDLINPLNYFKVIVNSYLQYLHILPLKDYLINCSDFLYYYHSMLDSIYNNVIFRPYLHINEDNVLINFVNNNINKTIQKLSDEWSEMPVKYINDKGDLIGYEYISKLKKTLQQNKIDTITDDFSIVVDGDTYEEIDELNSDLFDFENGESLLDTIEKLNDVSEGDIVIVDENNNDNNNDNKNKNKTLYYDSSVFFDVYESLLDIVSNNENELLVSIIDSIKNRVNNPSPSYQEYENISKEAQIAKGLQEVYQQYNNQMIREDKAGLFKLIDDIEYYYNKFKQLGLDTFEQSFIDDKYLVSILEEKEWKSLNEYENVPVESIVPEDFITKVCLKVIGFYETNLKKVNDSIHNDNDYFLIDLNNKCQKYIDLIFASNEEDKNTDDISFSESVDNNDIVLEETINSEQDIFVSSSFDYSLNTQLIHNYKTDIINPKVLYTSTLTSVYKQILERQWYLECKNFANELCFRLSTYNDSLNLRNEFNEFSPQVLRGYVINEVYKSLKRDYPDDPVFSKFKQINPETNKNYKMFELFFEYGKEGIALSLLPVYFKEIWSKTENPRTILELYSDISNYKKSCHSDYRFGLDRYYYELSFNNVRLNRTDKNDY